MKILLRATLADFFVCFIVLKNAVERDSLKGGKWIFLSFMNFITKSCRSVAKSSYEAIEITRMMEMATLL